MEIIREVSAQVKNSRWRNGYLGSMRAAQSVARRDIHLQFKIKMVVAVGLEPTTSRM
jgi:hypothetical protein